MGTAWDLSSSLLICIKACTCILSLSPLKNASANLSAAHFLWRQTDRPEHHKNITAVVEAQIEFGDRSEAEGLKERLHSEDGIWVRTWRTFPIYLCISVHVPKGVNAVIKTNTGLLLTER